jgi:hypothetical protein
MCFCCLRAPPALILVVCVSELSETSRFLVIHLAFSLSLPFSLNNLIRSKKIVMLFLVLQCGESENKALSSAAANNNLGQICFQNA